MRSVRTCTIALSLLGAACAGDEDNHGAGSATLRADVVTIGDGGVVLDCPRGPIGEIRVEFDCDSVTIYSCKDLSNVVLEDENGERVRFEDLRGQVGTFTDDDGARVTAVWVKAGANFSGDGPGYGTRFDAPEDLDCDDAPPDSGGGAGNGGEPLDPCEDTDPDTVCDEGEVPPGDDEPSEDQPGDDDPGDEGGGDPVDCLDNPDDPACDVI